MRRTDRVALVVFGAPGVRDPDHPCEAFEPGLRIRAQDGAPSHRGDCGTDGHYLCDECTRRATCPGGCGHRPSRCECPRGAERYYVGAGIRAFAEFATWQDPGAWMGDD